MSQYLLEYFNAFYFKEGVGPSGHEIMKKEKCDEAGEFGMCPYVTSQRLLQGKWAILILHALSGGPRRFGELQREIDITQATLAAQLKGLEGDGLINRKLYPEIPPRVEYSLTEIGSEFQPVLNSIETWGNKYIEFLKSGKSKRKEPSCA